MTIKIYKKDFSPFYRGVLSIINKYNLDVELIDVNIFEGEHMEAEYTAISPYQSIPCLVDDDVTVNQGVSILKYLCLKHNLPDYPQELKQRIKVDEMLGFLATDYMTFVNIMTNAVGLVPWVAYKSETTRNEVKGLIEHKKDRVLSALNERLATSKFLCGDTITIADYHGFGLVCFGFLNKDFSLDAYPNLNNWLLTNYSVAETYKSELRELAKGLEEFNLQVVLTE